MNTPLAIHQILFGRSWMPVRFTVEQLSLIDVACDDAITKLYAERVAAEDFNDVKVNIGEIDRQIRNYRKVQKAIRSTLDED